MWKGVEYQVEEIEKAWQEPGERHFLVRTTGNKSFKLSYNESQQQWTLIEVVQS